MEAALTGIRVLDLSRYIAGPHCAMLLADMGAEVVRVERPGGEEDRRVGVLLPDGQNVNIVNIGRNKKGITLNLQSQKGRAILTELVKRADVVIESFGVEAKEALELRYQDLSNVNPAIILVSISGYGQSGPYARRLSFDPVAQAESGAMSISGFPGSPPTRSAVAWVDYLAGTHAAWGAMVALFYREKTGRGQMVDVALLDVAVLATVATGAAMEYRLLGHVRPQLGNHSYRVYANVFQASDGWVFVSGVSDGIWKRLARAIGRPHLIADPRLQDDNARYENRDVIDRWLADWVRQRTVAEVVSILEQARVPCGRVNTIAQMVADPQVNAREMLMEIEWPGVGTVPVAGLPVKFSHTPGRIRTRAPLAGEHNAEVYGDLLGYGPEELARLAQEGVI